MSQILLLISSAKQSFDTTHTLLAHKQSMEPLAGSVRQNLKQISIIIPSNGEKMKVHSLNSKNSKGSQM